MEVPGLGAESELQLTACAIATATPDPSHICYLCCSSQQHWILKPLSKARDQTHILEDSMLSSYLAEPQQELWPLFFFFIFKII